MAVGAHTTGHDDALETMLACGAQRLLDEYLDDGVDKRAGQVGARLMAGLAVGQVELAYLREHRRLQARKREIEIA